MTARWFQPLGLCQGRLCVRAAVGILRGERNEEIGKFCPRCAQARLAEARRDECRPFPL